jgi:Phage protein (N4 Gp49/phage Sf6 gene 66) family
MIERNTMSTLEESDKEAAAVAVAPRVTLADIEGSIAAKLEINGERIAEQANSAQYNEPLRGNLEHLAVCLLVMKNGFMVIGKAAPASPENFDYDLGRKLAYEDCIRQLWPLMGFALRERLSAQLQQ